MSREVSKNFENITRNFEENFEKTKSNKKCIKSTFIRHSPLCVKQGFTFAPTDRELLKPRLH